MIRFIGKILAVFFLFSSPVFAEIISKKPQNFLGDGPNLTINWNSPVGKELLAKSNFSNDFYQLAGNFQPQMNPLYCGIATSVIILNSLIDAVDTPSQGALQVKKPKVFGTGFIPFKRFSQITFLNEETDKIKSRQIIAMSNVNAANENDAKNFDPGLSLLQLTNILRQSYGLKVRKFHFEKNDANSKAKLRSHLKQVLGEDKHFMVVNFYGKTIGLRSGGHISPVAAYNAKEDKVLILDVAGHYNSWYWVSVANLAKVLNTKDGDNYRGYIIVGKK